MEDEVLHRLVEKRLGYWRSRLSGVQAVAALKLIGAEPDAVVQVGLGCGDEVLPLYEAFQGAKFVAFDGNPRYVEEWRGLYPGALYHAAVSE